MTLNRTTGVLLAAVLGLGVAGSASAQTKVMGLNAEGSVEAGGIWYLTDEPGNKERAKFEEYRDMSQGFLLEGLKLRLFTDNEGYSTELAGSKWGRHDQEFSLRTGRTGLWQFEIDWDQLRHVFATNARTLMHQTTRGNWHIPRINSLSDFNGQATSRELYDVSVQWYTGRLNFTVTPTPDMELSAKYTAIRKEGDRPFSMSFGTGSAGNFLEVLEPIEQTIHDFRLGMAIARERWQLQMGYTLSVFQNDMESVTFENPCFQFAAAGDCTAADTNANKAQFGRSSLPPNNMAHTFNLAGGVNLPLRTRMTGGVTYSVALQDEGFLPLSTTPRAGVGVMPQSSLEGSVHTLNLSLGATSRPFRLPLTLSARYRLYDLNDRSDQFVLPVRPLNDRADSLLAAFEPERHSFTRHNADLDARYQIARSLAATIGTGWERWNRGPERMVQELDEVFLKAAVDATPTDWLLARLTYRPSIRRGDHGGHANPAEQFGYARDFDLADRDRQRVDLTFQITPLDSLSITPAGGVRYDEFNNTPMGIQEDWTWSAGIDIGWSPVERVSFGLGYMHEVGNRDLLAKQTTVSPNTFFLSNMTDTFDTVRLNSKVALIPKRLDWIVDASYATSYGEVKTRNPTGADGGTASPATSKRWPAIDDGLLRIETKLRYHLTKSWAVSFLYAFEQWRHHNWQTDNWLPYNSLQRGAPYGDVYLGTDAKDYDNHMMGLTFAYTFK